MGMNLAVRARFSKAVEQPRERRGSSTGEAFPWKGGSRAEQAFGRATAVLAGAFILPLVLVANAVPVSALLATREIMGLERPPIPAPAVRAPAGLPARATVVEPVPPLRPQVRLQLGAYRTEAAARNAWATWVAEQPELRGSRLHLERAVVNSATVFRLQVGLPGMAQAKALRTDVCGEVSDCFLIG